MNKSFCEDITEGKFSYPIIHAITSDPNNRQLQSMYMRGQWEKGVNFVIDKCIPFVISDILKQRTEDITMKKYCLEYMRAKGSLEYTRYWYKY